MEIVDRLNAAHESFPTVGESPCGLFKDAADVINEQGTQITDMAMLIRRMLLERQADRQAKQYLVANELMGS